MEPPTRYKRTWKHAPVAAKLPLAHMSEKTQHVERGMFCLLGVGEIGEKTTLGASSSLKNIRYVGVRNCIQ